MQTARTIIAIGAAAKPAAQSIAIACDPTIEGAPEQHATGEVHHRHRPPQPAKAEREVTHCCRPPVAVATGVDDAHLLHHSLVCQVGPPLGDTRIVQRQIGEFFLAIPPRQFADLGGADSAVAVVDYHVGAGPLVRAGKLSRHSFTAL